MKHFLLILLVATTFFSFGQNAPVAVDDTLAYRYDFIQANDSLSIFKNRLLANDYDSDGDSILIDSVLSAALGQVLSFHLQGSVFWVVYFPPQNYWGADSFTYVIRDNGNPVRYDTAVVKISIQYPTYALLDGNNINAHIDKDVLFSNPADGPGFEAPAGSGSHAIYAANLWITGKNNGNVYSNVRKFGDSLANGDQSSNCGPVHDFTYQGTGYDSKWDRVWKVKQYEIDYHLASWNAIGYNPPQSLLDWPAHGDTTIGENYYLAPFIDNDNDGNYNPYAGDYPLIKGDQAVYFIYNDGLSFYSQNPLQTEIHGMAYAFQCQDSALQNTIFVDYKIINRSTKTYDSTFFGMWADMDLGIASDDYIQCDVDRSLFYTFNGSDFDSDNNGMPGYGDYVPAQATLILKGAKQDDDGQDNAFGIAANQTINGTGFGDGILDNEHWGMEFFSWPFEYYGASPNFELRYYSNMSGTDTLGNPWAADFLNTGSPIAFKYLFPGSSDSYSYGTGGIVIPPWNEGTVSNAPGDRRTLGSTGPVTFAPGDEIELTYAFVFGRDYVNPGAQAGVTNMLERADSIRSYYNQGILAACGFPVSVKEPNAVKKDVVIYPNPTNDVINIRQEKANSITIQILDITGKVVFNTSSTQQLNTVDLSGFSNGVYLVKVNSGGKISVEKLIKN